MRGIGTRGYAGWGISCVGGECDDGFYDDYDACYDGGFNIAWRCFTGLVVLVYAR